MVRIGARLAGGKVTLSPLGSASRTLGKRHLFWAEFSLHGEGEECLKPKYENGRF